MEKPTPVNYLDTRCPSGTHYSHQGMSCVEIGVRKWNPITGYRTEDEMAANPPQFTGILRAAGEES